MTHDNGGPAYPAQGTDMSGHGMIGHIPGQSLLDHFAGLAMQAIVSQEVPREAIENGDSIANVAYSVAADMIAEKRRREANA